MIVVRLVNKHQPFDKLGRITTFSQQTSKANIVIEWISILRHCGRRLSISDPKPVICLKGLALFYKLLQKKCGDGTPKWVTAVPSILLFRRFIQ